MNKIDFKRQWKLAAKDKHSRMHMHDGMLDELESLIDTHGMANIMLALVHIADEKSEHVKCNWQDLELASAWRKVSDALISKRLSNALNRLPDSDRLMKFRKFTHS